MHFSYHVFGFLEKATRTCNVTFSQKKKNLQLIKTTFIVEMDMIISTSLDA
jgi:hypothetical protein